MYLSFSIIALNEEERIEKTLKNISNVDNRNKDIEINLVDGGSSDNTVEIAEDYVDNIYHKKFQDNFAKQRNFAKSKCNGRWIFEIDADELLTKTLQNSLIDILERNEGVDLLYFPRKNKVEGISQYHINKWNWNVDKEGDINYPDFQGRIYKNSGHLRWQGKVHEQLVGYQKYAKLPADKEKELYVIHNKDIDRQEKQNEYYQELATGRK